MSGIPGTLVEGVDETPEQCGDSGRQGAGGRVRFFISCADASFDSKHFDAAFFEIKDIFL